MGRSTTTTTSHFLNETLFLFMKLRSPTLTKNDISVRFWIPICLLKKKSVCRRKSLFFYTSPLYPLFLPHPKLTW